MKDEIDLSLLSVDHPVRLRDGRIGTYRGRQPYLRYPHLVEVDGLPEGYTDRGSYFEKVGQSPKDIVAV